MFTTLSYTNNQFRNWGFIEYIASKFELTIKEHSEVFEHAKKTKFKLGYPISYVNQNAKNYFESIFGNYLLESILFSNFKLCSTKFFKNHFKNFLQENYVSIPNDFLISEKFIETQLAYLKHFIQEDDNIYYFENANNLIPIIQGSGPYDYFMAYFIVGECIYNQQKCNTVKIITLGLD